MWLAEIKILNEFMMKLEMRTFDQEHLKLAPICDKWSADEHCTSNVDQRGRNKNLTMQVDAPSKMGRPKRTQMKVVRIDPMKCYLFEDLALMRLNPLI